MFTIFFSPATTPFAVAIVLMVMIAILEMVSALIGMSASSAIDELLPDVETDADIDMDAEGAEPTAADGNGVGALSQFLGWLCVGKVPVLVLLIVMLTGFGLTGFALQGASHALIGSTLPAWLATIPAVAAALPITRTSGLFLSRIMPKEETEAISRKQYIGKVATIVRGEARRGMPAEAKLQDTFGQAHYLLAEPDSSTEVFGAGEEVLIVSQAGSVYRVIRNTSSALSDGID